jgi:hypothetical protein
MNARRSKGGLLWANIALSLAAVLFAYLVAEPVFQLLVAPRLPLDKREFLPRPARVLAQSSKRGSAPRPGYVALIGDSHALGLGDWLLAADPGGRPDYHSAHLIHKKTGRDVVTFGRGGAGSIDGLVVEPLRTIAFLDGLLLFEMPEPGLGLVYFYEGNDLNDNLAVIERHFDPERASRRDQAYFQDVLARLATEARASAGPENNLLLGAFLFEAVDTLINASIKTVKRSMFGGEDEGERPEPVTRARIGGETVMLPPYLQGPALGLSEQELDLALFAFRQSLERLKLELPGTELAVVYLPAPLSVYEIVSKQVHAQAYSRPRHLYPAQAVAERSDAVASSVRGAAESLGLPFLDTRPALRRAAGDTALHGPEDWRHFNRSGYEVLVEALIEGLPRPSGRPAL